MIGLIHSGMTGIILLICLASVAAGQTDHANADGAHNADWFRDAKYGAFMHFLPGNDEQLALTDKFDTRALARQLEEVGAKYFIITIYQNSGYFISPNAAYNRRTGYKPGEKCSKRDLPLDLYKALHPKGIRLMVYVTSQTPNRDARAQKAFGLPEGAIDQPLDLEFAAKWAKVIREWSDRYGDKLSGWWFDGCYEHVHFNDAIADVYAKAAKHGNPKALVAFNPGVKVIRWTKAEDYTAGETNEPLEVVPTSRWLDGAQWHALTYVGSGWATRITRYTSDQWARWISAVTANGGVVTLDMGPNYDPNAGPIGSLAQAQVDQIKAVKAAIRGSASPNPPKRLER
jgi:hypothetical protein